MKKKVYTLYIISLIITLGCHKEDFRPESVNISLELAGQNKKELINALRHYSKNSSDSLQHQAACYLISYMVGHSSNDQFQEFPSQITSLFNSQDSLVKANYFNPYIAGGTEAANKRSTERSTAIRNALKRSINWIEQKQGPFEDLQTIKSEWLIDHIDNAFKAWRESPFASRLSFDEFKETLLPYRYRNEALDYTASEYRDLLYDVLNVKEASTTGDVVNRINTYSTAMSCLQKSDTLLGNLGPYDLLQFNLLGCDRHSDWTARALNALGVPAAYDFTPSWLNRSRMHYWVAVRDTNSVFRPFTPMWQELGDTIYFNETSTVFRKTFTPQPSPFTQKRLKEELPSIFNTPFLKDVSEEYHKVTALTIPFKPIKSAPNFGYLSIFSTNGWKPVAWGRRNKESSDYKFGKVPLFVMYVPGIYYREKIIPQQPPFYLDGNGKMHPFLTNSKRPINLSLKRKFHEKGHLIDMMIDMVGTKLQGANKSDFSDAEDLHTLSLDDLSAMTTNSFKVGNKKAFRYLRCLPKQDKLLHIASFDILSKGEKNNQKPTKVTVRALADSSNYTKLFDNNLETFITAKAIEFDLEKPTRIAEIQLAPRNSNNGIIIGDRYELLYYDNKWISAGITTATTNQIHYNNVPSNTLYWLRNLDRGKEEQAFLYNDGKQIFINEENYLAGKWTPFRNLMAKVLKK